MILTQNRERVRFLKFATVGALGAMIDFAVMNFMTHTFNMRLVFAGTISFICAVLSNFTLNRYWTYPDSRSRHIIHQLGMFFLVNAAGIAIRVPILHFLEPPLALFFQRVTNLPQSTAHLLAKNVTLAFAIAVVMIWNFFINRYWTYNDVD
ncbi:MAG TPA: GtrA family protein [Anaerolineales bacterium]|nr:GtrA family protein [Anaerolineales bacterium]